METERRTAISKAAFRNSKQSKAPQQSKAEQGASAQPSTKAPQRSKAPQHSRRHSTAGAIVPQRLVEVSTLVWCC